MAAYVIQQLIISDAHFNNGKKYKHYDDCITCDWENDITLADGNALDSHVFTHDYYFMCGDNVGNSNDSRYWGMVPEEYIVGVVSHISYSIDKHTGKYRMNRVFKTPK